MTAMCLVSAALMECLGAAAVLTYARMALIWAHLTRQRLKRVRVFPVSQA